MDEKKLLPLCIAIQQYYESVNAPTKVLPASLTSTEEIFRLAGVHHLTISPHLLAQLAKPLPNDVVNSLFDVASTEPIPEPGTSYMNDPGKYLITFARDQGGASQAKLTEVCQSHYEKQGPV